MFFSFHERHLTVAWLSDEAPARNLSSSFLSLFLNSFPLSAKREQLMFEKVGNREMVAALLLEDFLDSDPQYTRDTLITAKTVGAEICLEPGISLMLGPSLQIQASKVRLDGLQKLKAFLQRGMGHNEPQQLHLCKGQNFPENEVLKSHNNLFSPNCKCTNFQGNILGPGKSLSLFFTENKFKQECYRERRMCGWVSVKENNYLEVLKSGRETYLENTCFFQSKYYPSSSSLQIVPEHTQGDCRNSANTGVEEQQNKKPQRVYWAI